MHQDYAKNFMVIVSFNPHNNTGEGAIMSLKKKLRYRGFNPWEVAVSWLEFQWYGPKACVLNLWDLTPAPEVKRSDPHGKP